MIARIFNYINKSVKYSCTYVPYHVQVNLCIFQRTRTYVIMVKCTSRFLLIPYRKNSYNGVQDFYSVISGSTKWTTIPRIMFVNNIVLSWCKTFLIYLRINVRRYESYRQFNTVVSFHWFFYIFVILFWREAKFFEKLLQAATSTLVRYVDTYVRK